MEREEVLDFCGRWLPAWQGNKPGNLIEFYSDDALYIDPANKRGLRGTRPDLLLFQEAARGESGLEVGTS